MAGQIKLSDGSVVESTFKYGGSSYTLTQLDSEEQAAFNTHFKGLLGTDDSQIRKLLEDRKKFIEIAVSAVKNNLDNPRFEGIYPSDSAFGFTMLRPIHIGDTTATPDGKTTWTETVASASTHQAWIGASASDPFLVGGISGNLSAGWGGVVIIGVKSTHINPKVSEVKLWNNRNERVPVDTRDIVLGDNTNQVSVLPIPGEIFLPGDGMYATLAGDVTGTDYFAPIGLLIGYGKLLKRTTF